MSKEAKSKEFKALDELFHGTLKDIYFSEKKNFVDIAEDGKGCSKRRAEGCLRKAL